MSHQHSLLGLEVTGIHDQMHPGRSMAKQTWGLQQCRHGLNVDIVLLHLLRHKMPMTMVLSAKKGESANGYVADSLGGWPRT